MIQTRRARLAAWAAQAPRPAAQGADSIREISFHPLREPGSGRRYAAVRLRTADGAAGFGECAAVTPEGMALAQAALTGIAATAVEPARALLREHPRLAAAVNMAQLDLAAQRAGVPLYQFLGGPTRNRIRAMTPLAGDSDSALIESLKTAKAAGHLAFAVPLPPLKARNHGQDFIRAVVRRLESLATAAGDGCDFVLSGAGRLTPGDAAAVSAAVEGFHLLWFDEPCETVGMGAAAKLPAGSVTPAGFGAAITHPAGFQDLLREGMAGVVRPSLGLHGITQIRKIAALAETYYVAAAPGHAGGPIATAAALHLAASLPNFFIQETPLAVSGAARRMRDEIAGAALETPVAGYLSLPTGPGLGIRVSAEALAKYREREA